MFLATPATICRYGLAISNSSLPCEPPSGRTTSLTHCGCGCQAFPRAAGRNQASDFYISRSNSTVDRRSDFLEGHQCRGFGECGGRRADCALRRPDILDGRLERGERNIVILARKVRRAAREYGLGRMSPAEGPSGSWLSQGRLYSAERWLVVAGRRRQDRVRRW